ncbi:MAG: hypothetical protein JST08_16595 [Actinobacteria bacterium]|nr:hypothetical protein [Actinomycetota bacterium]
MNATELLRGAVDLHIHPSPSPYPRRVDAIGAAEAAARHGMRAIVLKSHHSDTAMLIDAFADRGLAEIPVTVKGGVVLNSQVGGINPHAVALSLAMGGRIVWLPTISAPPHIASTGHAFPTATVDLPEEPPVDVWADAEGGELKPELHEILAMLAKADAILASGHVGAASIVATFEAAHAAGVRRLLVNHPNFIVDVGSAEARRLVELGAYIEHEASMYDERSKFHAYGIETLEGWIELAGPEHTVLASDLGQANNPLPPESLALIAERLSANGTAAEDLRALLARNPARLLGLDEDAAA